MRATRSLAILALTIAACSRSPVAPSTGQSDYTLTDRLETAHLVFHYSPGDFVDAERAEAYHDWAVAFLNVTCPKKVDYYKFKDRAQQYEVAKTAVSGWAVPSPAFEVWTYLPFMNHEQFHLYSMLVGRPTTFFVEGIAVAYQVDPLAGDYEAREKSGEPIHDVARRYRRSGQLLPISQIVESDGWGTGDFTVTYIQAGSFVRYLADIHGLEKLKQLFRAIDFRDTGTTVSTKFAAIYGISLGAAEKQWLGFMDQ